MRITRIKFSGFKSFVDSTTLSLPGNLTGVVGPNGCGKSNIIDALIWVLGESSAKHLRGESMADVIFNGSNTRKPVGQATVEIVFDNTDGTIGGQYAGFGEIAIKRTVSRDGVSSYFLNGSRCRRKDITQVFLGTGIGSRGYSVIEQGMISRVIEAKPEELRAFLEEAAGISKYKERRRETETRMRHTDENIERLDDIREELDKQLGHLQRQARAAERYQAYKIEERSLESRVLAARYRALDRERTACATRTEQRVTAHEGIVARLREVESTQTRYREAQTETSERFNDVQSVFYARQSDIARLEQDIRHAEDRQRTLSTDRDDAVETLAQLAAVITDEQSQSSAVATRIGETEPRLTASRNAEQTASEQLQACEARLLEWQSQWDEFNRTHNDLAQEEQATRIRLENLLAAAADTAERRSSLDSEAENHDTSKLGVEVADLRGRIATIESERQRLQERRNAIRANTEQARGAIQALGSSLHEQQAQLEEQRGRLASLHALQEAAFGDDQEAIERWLREQGVDDGERLAELVDVEPGWERALEAALRIPLGTLCGDGLVDRLAASDRRGVEQTRVTVVDRGVPAEPPATSSTATRTLAEVVSGPVDLAPLLHDIHTAADADSGRRLLGQLPRHAIVALADGTLIGHGWMQVPAASETRSGILVREREIATLGATLEKHEADTANLREQLAGARTRLEAMEREGHEIAEAYDDQTRQANALRDQLAASEAELRRREARAADIMAELERLARVNSENESAIAGLRETQARAEQAVAEHQSRRDALVSGRNSLQAAVDEARQAWRECREAAHALELDLQRLHAEKASLVSAAERNATARSQLEQRCAEFEREITALEAPRKEMGAALETALGERATAERDLTEVRRVLGELDEQLRQSTALRGEIEAELGESQSALEQARLEERALEVRMQELRDRYGATEGAGDFEETLQALTDEDSEEHIGTQLEKLAARIQRLGPINLAAIEEYEQLSERKAYLDKQHDDLTQALETLQDAIRKIDRDTRTRFKETYDKVNNGLQQMFPVLFGGGHAYLELTGEDLLETGVTVMARPPGKRNSTIHLLSGGEKALTALAFVFSIFELNPAPFCLLDEVDAPLDDANVVRLTEMLQTMASTVQFLFVTHNKITMEIAEQLIGVTMQEPGVSRLVSVNMEEAVELAATA